MTRRVRRTVSRGRGLELESLEPRRLLAAASMHRLPATPITTPACQPANAAPVGLPANATPGLATTGPALVRAAAVPAVSVISTDIVRNTTFLKGTTYIVDGEVHVRSGVTLTIEDGVTVLIRNGYRNNRLIDTNALVFDSGSRMRAATVTFAAADSLGRAVPFANNGGVYFCGTARSATKDGISVNAANPSGRSSFTADLIIASYAGRPDPKGGDGDDNRRDDIDAISVLGMDQTEWRVKAVRTDHSGDDGFDVMNSSITLDSLTVVRPTEDGLNVTSSFVQIRRQLAIDMSTIQVPDRELFDFEVDDGPVRVLIDRSAIVDLAGYWGNVYDGVALNSPDMPSPPRRGGPSQWYEFHGTLRRGPAIVYSIKAD